MKPFRHFFTSLNTPPASPDALQVQRERILTQILRGMAVLGAILITAAFFEYGLNQQRWAVMGLFFGVYLWALIAALIRRLPYKVRAISLLAIIYTLGLVTIMIDGLQGNSRLYLLAFTVISGILLGTRGGIVSLVISLATIGLNWALTWMGVVQPVIHDTNNLADGAIISYWALAWVAFMAIASATTISMSSLVFSLETSLRSATALTRELEEGRSDLEKNVTERTEDLQRRLTQIRTAAEITNAISSYLDPATLLQQVVDLVREGFGLYYVGVFLLDERNEYAILRAGTGEAGQKMVSEGHRLAVGGASMIGWTVSNRTARIALDVGAEAVRFSNPYLPQTRSELALPLLSGERVLGAMTVQSTNPEAFDEDDITVLQGMADSLSTAVQNARLFQEVGAKLDEIRTLHQQYLSQEWGEHTRREGELSYTYSNEQPGDALEQMPTLEVPLLLREQQIGRVVLESDRTAWSTEEKAFIESVAAEAAVALENARLLAETQRRAERERIVTDVTGKVRTFTEIESVMKTAIQEVGARLRATSGMIVLHGAFDEQPEGGSNGNSQE